MPRLEDSEVADEYGPDRFMPREVDGGNVVALDLADYIAGYLEGAVESGWSPQRVGGLLAEALLTDEESPLRQRDAEVAAKALEATADDVIDAAVRARLDGGFDAAKANAAWLRDRAARIRAEAQR